MPINEYGERVIGFYLVGFFSKGRLAKCSFQKAKPFKVDLNGRAIGIVFRGFKENRWASDWIFIENRKMSEIDKDVELRKELNKVWKDWCKKHKRKYSPILKLKIGEDEL